MLILWSIVKQVVSIKTKIYRTHILVVERKHGVKRAAEDPDNPVFIRVFDGLSTQLLGHLAWQLCLLYVELLDEPDTR